jgi:phosphotriesterase-related protein
VTNVVQTVTGPIDASELGFTLPHEHLVFGMTGWDLDYWPTVPAEEQVRICTEWVDQAKSAGVRSLVEVSTPEMGRDVNVMREVSERTGVHIICATGLYARRPLAYFLRRDTEEIAEFFLHELQDGIGTSGARAGLIKCAIESPQLSGYEQTVLGACARAAMVAGVPVMVHTEAGAALAAARFLSEAGLPGSQTIIAHAESTPSFDDLLVIADELGAYVGFDRFGYEVPLSDAKRCALVGALCHLGLAHRVLLSHDAVCVLHGRDAHRWDAVADLVRNWRFDHLAKEILPRLSGQGITQAQIEQMTEANPAALLSGASIPASHSGGAS